MSDNEDSDYSQSTSTSSLKENKQPEASSSKTNTLNKKKTVEEIYQKKSQIEHILLRPDTYIGSVECVTEKLWVYDSEKDSMVYRDVTIVPGLYKIVDEILVNAADNKIRDPSMNTIKVKIDKEQNLISIYNNGKGIPIEMHKDENIYVPELIFGHLLTSSNYDDNEKKVTGGRNGYGAKLTNIFSTEFIVETTDTTAKKKYRQVFKDNMSVKQNAKLTSYSKKEEYTEITFKPDLAKFGLTELTDDIIALLKKRVFDMAGCSKNVKVFLNDERLKIRNFKEYIQKYLPPPPNPSEDSTTKSPDVIHEQVNERWEVGFTPSQEGQFQQVSFVNSIATTKGGTHVNHVVDQLVTRIMETVKKKQKDAKLKPFQIKNHISIYINCLIENPSFTSQTKEFMSLKEKSFGSSCTLSENFINKVLKSVIITDIIEEVKQKQDKELKKTDGAKKSSVLSIEKLEDAGNAGGKFAQNCTLILTEGDSAKSLAVAGISVVGRKNFGVFPLRGKLLNVRDASHTSIMSNEEIQNIKKILGLQHNKQYTSTKDLRYGHLMIMTDQDYDGSHIKGLIINLLDHFYPSLLKIPDFLREFITPIVKCTHNRTKEIISFYTIPEYEQWKSSNDDGKGWTIKYYKGLGTSEAKDAKEYFSDLPTHMKPFRELQQDERSLIDMAFNKKKADDRKEWLRTYQPGTFMDHSVDEITISDFINKELILYSMADNARSIPSVIDGFKPGQRKVMYGCFKRNLNKEVKVAQLAGYISEHSAYHHGEQSLTSTIIGLAYDFVGSNNINLLQPRGTFGTRAQGGKDAASARYINTALQPITRLIFHKSDDNLLKYLNDDGQMIEPVWYCPIIPMVLVNGSEGIGTGWSSYIPNYNPMDLVKNILRLMEGKEQEPMHPLYRGFKGTINPLDKDKYTNNGVIERISPTEIKITELPVRTWTQNYKKDLIDKFMGFINKFDEEHKSHTVEFDISLKEEVADLSDEDLAKKFKIISTLATSNMVCFDLEGRLKKYKTPEDILQEFYHIRLDLYSKRKDYLIAEVKHECLKLANKVRFINMKIKHQLEFEGLRKKAIIELLEANGFDKIHKRPIMKYGSEETSESDEENASDSGYNYLMSTPAWAFSKEESERINSLKNEKEKELKILEAKPPKEFWKDDLKAFEDQWNNDLAEFEENINSGGVTKKGKKRVGLGTSEVKRKKTKRLDGN
ncbi:DNA topoisomerase II [Gigaspora rosea]|uniref:DNA topoisomerase 2 n=1 Tax=Gigaspora rosea TaxID=44941 RepID=A0A397V552_9GLOM|nr:DNA topoisomerase II [Gigaspora rosea]